MGQAKVKKTLAQIGDQMVSKGSPNDTIVNAPPQGNTGGNGLPIPADAGNRSASDRLRVNISVPEGIHAALMGIAQKTGMSVAQASLAALTAGLPVIADQVDALQVLRS